MQQEKIKVTYFFRKPRPQYHSIERVFGLIIDNLSEDITPTVYKLSGGEKGFFSRIKALLEVRKNRGKINHITGDISYVALVLPKKRLIITFHDLESLERRDGIRSRVLKWFWVVMPARRAKLITVVSNHTRDKLIEWTGVSESKIKVISNPLPKGFVYTPKVISNEKPLILAVGTKPNKNLEGTIRAIEGIRCRLLIVGRLTDKQVGLLNEKGVEYENLTGASDEQIIDAYKQCDILCFPSFFEGFGMPIIEAQAVGRPVITSRYGAMREVAGDGALLVDPNNYEEIGFCIKRLISDDELRMRLVENGLLNSNMHNPVIVTGQYSEIYNTLH
jgi:glycosyltransferase involved in cell wall biosynthesis